MGKIWSNTLLMAMKNAFKSPGKGNNENRSSKRREHQEQDYSEDKKRMKRRWIFQKYSPYETTIRHHVARSTTLGEYLVNFASPDAVKCQQERIFAFALASPVVAETATGTAAQATTEVVRMIECGGKQHAATVIQTAFRGYLARQALAALKGIVKLQALIRGHNVRMQAMTTLHCMQALIRVQTEVCGQRKNLIYERSLASQFSSANCTQDSDTVGRILTSTNVTKSEDVDRDEEFLAKKIHELLQNTKELLQDVKTTFIMPSPSREETWSSGKEEQTTINDGKQEENAGYFGWKKNKQRAQIIRTSSYEEKEDIKIVEIDNIQGRHSSYSYSASSPLNREHHTPAASQLKMQLAQVDSDNQGLPKQERRRSYSAPQTPRTGFRFYHKVKGREHCVPSSPKHIETTASAATANVPRHQWRI